MDLCFVQIGDVAYEAALDLRHREFYAFRGMALEQVPDELEEVCLHLVARQGQEVVGYGRLTILGDEARIS